MDAVEPDAGAGASPGPGVALDLEVIEAGDTTWRFDRTFLFVVHDAVNGTPILLGRITDPTAS